MEGRIVVVTGASRGVGRGIAIELASCGATVYGTGRTIGSADLPDSVIRVQLDQRDDEAVANAFRDMDRTHGRLDVLVNAAWGGYERMVEDGRFTWPLPFWEQPLWRWSAMMDVGVRAAFVASREAAKRMVAQASGLIVHVSYWAARKHIGNALYGAAKAATDKLAADMATELRDHGVAVVSLYPGLVRTEAVVQSGVFDLSNSESAEFQGRAVAALCADPRLMERSGAVVVTASLARELEFTDIDGKSPRPLTLEEA